VRTSSAAAGPVPGMRSSLSHPSGAGGDLQGPLQRSRHAAGPLRVRQRLAGRPGGEETLLPCPAGRPGAVVRHGGLRSALRLLPKLDQLAGAAGPSRDSVHRGGRARRPGPPRQAARRPGRDLHLQRAAHHQRVGGGRLPRGCRGRAGLRVRLKRQCQPRGARLSATLGVPVQGRPEGLSRPSLPRPRRHPGARGLDHPRAPRTRALGGSGHAGGARAQRLGTGAEGHRGFPGVGFPRHPVARDRVPSGLQDGGPPAHRSREPATGRGDRRRAGVEVRLRGEPPWNGADLGEHLLPGMPGPARRAAGLPVVRDRIPDGVCPECSRHIPGVWGSAGCGQQAPSP